ncbi:mCG147091 [Mus musculus]|jgi:hypothetical protein|nr:mCG147091 [Mus musculus]
MERGKGKNVSKDLKTGSILDHNVNVGFLAAIISLWGCKGENVVLRMYAPNAVGWHVTVCIGEDME